MCSKVFVSRFIAMMVLHNVRRLELGPLTWNAVHSARLIARDNGTLELSDTETYDWCLIRATDPRFDGARIRLAVEVRFIDPTAQFYVNHWGGIDICAIDAAGRTMFASGDVEIGASRRDRDTVSIVVEFFNGHETLSFGACRGSPGQYAGSGQRLIEFVSINVGIVILSCPEEDRIVLADVGAMDGLQREWLAQGRRVRPVLFEPNPESARGLRERIAHLPGGW